MSYKYNIKFRVFFEVGKVAEWKFTSFTKSIFTILTTPITKEISFLILYS